MPPSRWICISTHENDEITRKKHIWGVAKRYGNIIARVKIGDTLLMYTMQKIIDREVIPSAVTGIYEVISDIYEEETPIFVTPRALGNEVFPVRIKVKPVKIFEKPLEFKPFVPEMSFIKNKIMWSGSIRTAMREIPEEDYQKIIKQKHHKL
jgi:predicted RNA-binding protein